MTHPENNNGFTLIEIMLAMTVFAIIMTTVLIAIQNLSIARIKTESRVNLLEELYFFSEQLVTQIKEWGTIDYEEYWNRQTYWTQLQDGSYSGATGFGNYWRWWIMGNTVYWNGLYYCISGNNNRMGTGWCTSAMHNSAWLSQGGEYQRYWQYALQFIDYNSNADDDNGDEDSNGSPIDDEDDKDLWNAPIVFSGSIPELYLINRLEKTRLYLRYIVRQDKWTDIVCTISNTGAIGEWCVGNIQILKMLGRDVGFSHSWSEAWAYDGEIDTWILDPDWTGTWPLLSIGRLATGGPSEWVDLFPNTINVKNVSFQLYPQKDPWLSWDAKDCTQFDTNCISPFIHPYVRLQMVIGFSWDKRKILRNDNPIISINTTITLGDKE
jgi:prepilin-type N-terminal cleavage/methylation domain-containing protein